MDKITFQSEETTLTGHLFLPSEPYTLGAKLPAIIIGGSWLTVKEQMAELYAQKLMERALPPLHSISDIGERAVANPASMSLASPKPRTLRMQ